MADRLIRIFKGGSVGPPLLIAKWCENFFCRLRGLMFRRELPAGVGLVLVEKREGITNTSIHMFAVLFSIGVVWVDEQGEVVDKVVAHPWRVYAPRKAARFIIEGPPGIVDQISMGEKVEFRDDV
jgi:uncharacterized membrane protein (UPF0127 family)